jgi:three-Cys-motif partner protein
MDPNDYRERPQAYVKHTVLQKYLRVLALKVGQFARGTTLNYVDGFSGPWDDGRALHEGRPTSPAVAVRELRDAREQLRGLGVAMTPRALFVESDRAAYARLQQLRAKWTDIETLAIEGRFEEQIAHAQRFAESGSKRFAFVFIDPTGWTGYGLDAITPLLRVRPCEVLINFMLKDIVRHVGDARPEIQRTFDDLFGLDASRLRAQWAALEGHRREEAIVEAYCERIREVGNFKHCVSTIILNPTADRTHYHLVFATRSLAGLVVFRDTERIAMGRQTAVRAKAKQDKRVTRTKQTTLGFEPIVTDDSPYQEQLAERFAARARAAVQALVAGPHAEVAYEDVIETALGFPMVCESDVKAWIKEWRGDGSLEVVGLGLDERVPHLNRRHRLRRLG